MKKRTRGLTTALLSLVLLVAVSIPAEATWSVVGVDPETGEVGVAVASCVELGALSLDDGFELVALSPGHGAGISQAAYNADARVEIQRLLDQGQSANEVVEAVSNADFDADFETRQHGVVVLGDDAAGFTGSDNSDVAVDRQGPVVSAQGNLLVSEAVVVDAVAAFGAPGERSLAERLVDALEAGSNAGGDGRCAEQTALFAHVSVIDGQGNRARPNVVDLTTWVDRGDGNNPVTELAQLFRSGTTTVRPDVDELPSPVVPTWLVVSAAVIAAGVCALILFLGRRLFLR